MRTSLTEMENIFIDVEVTEFEELVKLISAPLISNKDVVEAFPEEVIKREVNFPTGLPTEPFCVAIPHTDAKFVLNNKVTIAVLKKPIKMEIMGSNDEPKIEVSIVFLLALGQSNKQLNILQKLMVVFGDKDILCRIKSSNKEEIYKIVKEEIEL